MLYHHFPLRAMVLSLIVVLFLPVRVHVPPDVKKKNSDVSKVSIFFNSLWAYPCLSARRVFRGVQNLHVWRGEEVIVSA